MGCCKTKKGGCTTGLTEEQKKVLEALNSSDAPMASKDLAEMTGLTGQQVSCRLRSLKTKGYVESPARCKYVITENGKNALNG